MAKQTQANIRSFIQMLWKLHIMWANSRHSISDIDTSMEANKFINLSKKYCY